jgi:hypothetical protein
MKTRPVLVILFMLLIVLASACASPTTQAPQATAMQKPAAEIVLAKETQVAPNAAAPNDSTVPNGDTALISYNPASRMVIKDGLMELLVEDTDLALAQVTQLAADYGGYILSSETWYSEDFKYGRMRLGIPSTSFENALNGLRELGVRVVKETASGQDVSAEYTDLQSKLTNLEATAARVREFLTASTSVDESLKINDTLSGLEAQIEQVKGQMNFYEGRSAFSTITVELTPQRPTPEPTPTPTPTPPPTPPPAWNPGNTLQSALGVLVGILQQVTDMLIWLVVVGGPFALALGVLYWIVRKLNRHVQRQMS